MILPDPNNSNKNLANERTEYNEPWTSRNEGDMGLTIRDKDEDLVTYGLWFGDDKRIVGCVNYCQNILTEDLEEMQSKGHSLFDRLMTIVYLEDEINQYEQGLEALRLENKRLNNIITRYELNFELTGDIWDNSWDKNYEET